MHPSIDATKLQRRERTDTLILHCAATPPTADVGADEIAAWHRARSFNGIGYHFVIRRDGRVEEGRPLDSIGAHAKPWNATSVGVCLVGGVGPDARTPQDNFTPQQWTALRALLLRLRGLYPGAKIIGHRDVPGVAKACPSFDAQAWAARNGF